MDVSKWFGQAGSAIASTLLVLFLCALGAFALIGTHETGFDTKLGDTFGTGVQLTIEQGGPAIANIFGPSAEIAKESLKNVGPSGTSDWGFVTLDWDQMMGRNGSSDSGDNSSNGSNSSNNGNSSNGGNSNNNSQPTGCTLESTADSQAALQYWNEGQWNNALSKLQQTNPSQDCLAASMESTFRDFNDKLAQLPTITDAGLFDMTLQELISINPQVKVLYAARAMRNAAQWANTVPVDFTQAADIFKGATISVVSVHHSTSGGESLGLEIDIDYVSLKFDWGNNWMFTLDKISKDDAKALATAIGEEDESFFLQEGKAMMAGSVDAFVPANLPTPKDPRVDYQQPQQFQSNSDVIPTAPAQQSQVGTCTNVIDYISETIPDNTVQSSGTTFTKSWTLQNDGTCTWTSGYALVFDSGESMGGSTVNLTSDVAPGGSVTVSVTLTAPANAGTYQGNWMLADANGVKFGLPGNKPIWVKIRVQ